MGKSKALQISVWNFPFADRAEGNGLDFNCDGFAGVWENMGDMTCVYGSH